MAEQSYEYLMNAARNADAAGDQNAAKRLVQLAMQKRSAPAPQAQRLVAADHETAQQVAALWLQPQHPMWSTD